MCGIFAILCKSSSTLPSDAGLRLQRALDSIRHRGPNARGSHIDPSGKFAIGHVRLSVIDLDESSNQPFWSVCGRYFVVFNGEIYNYLELRSELETEGVIFRTKSDTEVLLAALVKWGPESINRLNGMWSFVFGDVQTARFLISRDRWGVKPLFSYEEDGQLVVCSEAKGIIAWLGSTPSPNKKSIGLYLKYGIGGECEQSWFEGINRFPQASFQAIDLQSPHNYKNTIAPYWRYPIARTIENLEVAERQLELLLADAIKIRLRSDVPVGLSLSAGLDSASIAWITGTKISRSLDCYTAWYEPVEKSELFVAQSLAAQFGHHSIGVPESTGGQLVQDLRTCIYHLDAGHSSSAIVPYLNLCRDARTKLTVMLEGQGSDELFGGYTEFNLFAGLDYLLRGNLIQASSCVAANVHAVGWVKFLLDCVRFSFTSIYKNQASRWNAERYICDVVLNAENRNFRAFRFGKENFSDALEFWHRFNLTNLLQIGDAVSMSVNLETRCPFLDYRLVEFGFSLDTKLLLRDGFGKYVLRKVAELGLPEDVVWRRKIGGFENSTVRQINEYVEQHGLPSAAVELGIRQGIFRAPIRDSREFLKLPDNVKFRIYSILLWIEIFYQSETSKSTKQ
jgi:asparagine synthase (glutamine-hydrolysing)